VPDDHCSKFTAPSSSQRVTTISERTEGDNKGSPRSSIIQKGGTRYPIIVAMRDTVTMPKSYQDLMKMLVEREAAVADKKD